MKDKSIMGRLKEGGESFLDNAKHEFGYYVARPLICGGLFVLAGMQLSDIIQGNHSSRRIAPRCAEVQKIATEDIYRSMSPEEAIKYVDSYGKAKDYVLNHIQYADHKGYQSFEETHRLRKGVCRDATQAVLSLLSDDTNRYDTFFMALNSQSTNDVGHAVALINDRKLCKFGSLGINECDCIEPTCESIQAVYDKINQSFSNQFSRDYCKFIAHLDGTNVGCVLKYNLRTKKFE